MSATIYQKQLEQKLIRVFSEDHVIREWSIWNNATDMWGNKATYAPRLDIAVGPFNLTTANRHDDVDEIQRSSKHPLIETILAKGIRDNPNWTYNPNPRCLLAIEIEFSGSSKHILGDYTNASMMGYVGIVISSDKNYTKIKRIGDYARTLRELEKAPADLFCNTILYHEADFYSLVEEHITRIDKQ